MLDLKHSTMLVVDPIIAELAHKKGFNEPTEKAYLTHFRNMLVSNKPEYTEEPTVHLAPAPIDLEVWLLVRHHMWLVIQYNKRLQGHTVGVINHLTDEIVWHSSLNKAWTRYDIAQRTGIEEALKLI
jgi:hypothetical protein